MNQVIRLLRSHRSIRKFTTQQIGQEIVDELVRAGQAASTSSFIQACTVMQVNERGHRELLAEYAGNQAYVADAPVFLVFCADMQRHRLACRMQATEMLSGYTEQFITASVDCALFAQNVLTAAESLGLGGVLIGGIRNQIQQVADLLDLPDLVFPVFGLCLGYPDQNPEIKPRLPLSVVLKQDRYDDSADSELISAYDREVQPYYRSRSGGTKETTWSQQIAGLLSKESRPHMRDFLQKKGFLLK